MQGNLARSFSSVHIQYFLSNRLSALTTHQSCSIHKQLSNDKINLPEKPKRPLSPFLKFIGQVRPNLVTEFPQMNSKEIVKVAAKRWSNLESKLKNTFSQQYKEELEKYTKMKTEYVQKLTPEQKAEIKREKLRKIEIEEERSTKKRIKVLGKPKQPLSTFFRFLMSRRVDQGKYPSHRDWIKAVSEEWKTVSPEIKAKFEEERKHDYDKWLNELKHWEERMVKEGNVELVRKRFLLPKVKGKPVIG